jgi:ethanolamine utilization protein EutN
VKLALVVGTVVSTIQHPLFDGRKLLLCDILDATGRPDGNHLIAVDVVGAGTGETVLLLDEGTSARQIVGEPGGPLRTVAVGIVDELTDDGRWGSDPTAS